MRRRKQIFMTLVMALALASTLTAGYRSYAAASYRLGDRSETVKTIQQKLIRWGYLDGTADGIFGSATEAAVKHFQRSNGLSADGIAGAATLKALGISAGTAVAGNSSGATSSHLQGSIDLLAKVISAEARGEPYSGQVAVGAVILNRISHPAFPSTVAGVVYQKGAFSCMDDGQINEPVAQSAYRAAQEALNGKDPTGGAIYYFNPVTATNAWIWSRPLITVIGKHRFCS